MATCEDNRVERDRVLVPVLSGSWRATAPFTYPWLDIPDTKDGFYL
jgi:hypothetical protein